MSKLYAYMHKGRGGCNKPAFYLTERPQPGVQMHSDTVITVEGELPNKLGRVDCGGCGGNLDDLNTAWVKPVTMHQVINLLDKAMNRQAATQQSAEKLYDNLFMLHELLTKVHPDDQQSVYKGSALEATVEQLLGLDELDIELQEDKQIVDAGGKAMVPDDGITLSEELDNMNDVLGVDEPQQP